ncbi:MAG: PKD domain-containing protein [Myxococcales bacterium]|nr:PKD domain-containing protein [Myxococcales bacterium]
MRRLVIGAAGLLLLLLVLVLVAVWPVTPVVVDDQPRDDDAPAVKRLDVSPSIPQRRLAGPDAAASSRAPRPVQAKPQALDVVRRTLIEDVTLTPTSPCAGEDIRVRVSLVKDAKNARVTVTGQPTNPAVVRFAMPGDFSIPVIARDWREGIETRRVPVTVRRCPARPIARVRHTLLQDDKVAFRITTSGLSPPLKFTWTFGDGEVQSTTTPHVVHDYAMRPQKGPDSTFVAMAKVTGSSAGTATGRVAVGLPNSHWMSSQRGIIVLPAVVNRFAALGKRSAAVPVRIRNISEEAVEFDHVTILAWSCRSDTPAQRVTVAASTVLNATAVGAGEQKIVQLRWASDRFTQRPCRAEVRLRGTAGRKFKSLAMFALELGSPDSARRVRNPAFVRKLLKAEQLLGRSPVSAQDLKRLEAEGRL